MKHVKCQESRPKEAKKPPVKGCQFMQIGSNQVCEVTKKFKDVFFLSTREELYLFLIALIHDHLAFDYQEYVTSTKLLTNLTC